MAIEINGAVDDLVLESTIKVHKVVGGYEINIGNRRGFAAKWSNVPMRVKELLTPDFNYPPKGAKS